MKIISVVGARPNFMKIAPFIRAISHFNKQNIRQIHHLLVHTGQHYDDRMSAQFFEELNIPPADINLGIGSGSHAEQVGKTMIAFEQVLIKEKPGWVVVVGDVNATLACSVAAKKLQIKVCHIEAGLRSFDMSMPEEINRLVTDRLSDLLLTPDAISTGHLIQEGTASKRIKLVGNIMIDTLDRHLSSSLSMSLKDIVQNNQMEKSSIGEIDGKYGVVTLHRPSNVDHQIVMEKLVQFIVDEVVPHCKIIWPIHPRTAKNLKTFKLWEQIISVPGIYLLQPVGYLEMLRLNSGATFVMTDSGGLQEECCVLGTPCLTLRDNTERPVTTEENGGLSRLVGNSIANIRSGFNDILPLQRKPFRPPLWDGHTAERCLKAILDY